MIKKIIYVILLLSICIHLFSEDFTRLMNKYIENQNKVKSLVASGSISIKMKDESGKVINESSNSITIYMKYPNLFKLVMKDPMPAVIVQEGNIMTQKIGSYPAVTNKVDEASDLFKKYFAYGMGDYIDTSSILGQETVIEEGKTLYKFSMKVDVKSGQNGMFDIDRGEVFFNEDGMIVRQVLYYIESEIMRIELNYVKKDDIYLVNKMKTIMSTLGMNMENTISYSALSVNTRISNKEFEVK